MKNTFFKYLPVEQAILKKIRQLTQKPLVAIGNMNLKNAKAVQNAGADCIAVVSAICGANNPEKAAYELKNELLK